jgi:hypothetical protein
VGISKAWLRNRILLNRIWRILDFRIRKKARPFPLVFQIQTIDLCNGSCIMCPRSNIKDKKSISMSNELSINRKTPFLQNGDPH